ncbi:hypothetical protein SMICM304S_08396 [Streptomyces microflavus]
MFSVERAGKDDRDRIDVNRVDWVDVPAGSLWRGTPADAVAEVARRYADTGVPEDWYRKEAPRTRAGWKPSGWPVPPSRSASGGCSRGRPAG